MNSQIKSKFQHSHPLLWDSKKGHPDVSFQMIVCHKSLEIMII
jgi:hypothetical protein